MKEYLVIMECTCNSIFIVSAKNAKDAIAQVFEKYFEPQNESLKKENKKYDQKINHIYTKSDFTARSINNLHNQKGKIICVN